LASKRRPIATLFLVDNSEGFKKIKNRTEIPEDLKMTQQMKRTERMAAANQ
jgi:hypothetical protein